MKNPFHTTSIPLIYHRSTSTFVNGGYVGAMAISVLSNRNFRDDDGNRNCSAFVKDVNQFIANGLTSQTTHRYWSNNQFYNCAVLGRNCS
jgi:hypothetical protein